MSYNLAAMGSLEDTCPVFEVYPFVIMGPDVPSRKSLYPVKSESLFTLQRGDYHSGSFWLGFFFFLSVSSECFPRAICMQCQAWPSHIEPVFQNIKMHCYVWHSTAVFPRSLRAEIATPTQHTYHGSLLPGIAWCPWK